MYASITAPRCPAESNARKLWQRNGTSAAGDQALPLSTHVLRAAVGEGRRPTQSGHTNHSHTVATSSARQKTHKLTISRICTHTRLLTDHLHTRRSIRASKPLARTRTYTQHRRKRLFLPIQRPGAHRESPKTATRNRTKSEINAKRGRRAPTKAILTRGAERSVSPRGRANPETAKLRPTQKSHAKSRSIKHPLFLTKQTCVR